MPILNIDRRKLVTGSALLFFTAPVCARPSTKTDLQRSIDAGAGGVVHIPAGIFEIERLLLPSNTRLIGAGIGRTILKAAPNLRQPVITNARGSAGDWNIVMTGLTIDGNGTEQSELVNGLQFENVSLSHFEIEVRSCAGTGLLLSGGEKNAFGPDMFVHANGRDRAGYGLYIFGSSDNRIVGGRYHDNCIGIVIEASRAGGRSRRNSITGSHCVANRADFGQSGAGIHFEQTDGGDCSGGVVTDVTCTGSTGVGINNTGCDLRIVRGMITNNRESAITTIAAIGIAYTGVVCRSNARGASNAYRAEMRFDDTGLIPGTTGSVTRCDLRGNAPDGGIRCMSVHSQIAFVDNRVTGYQNDYIFSGKRDRLSKRRGA